MPANENIPHLKLFAKWGATFNEVDRGGFCVGPQEDYDAGLNSAMAGRFLLPICALL